MEEKILAWLEWEIPEHEQFTLQCFAPMRPGKVSSVKEQIHSATTTKSGPFHLTFPLEF